MAAFCAFKRVDSSYDLLVRLLVYRSELVSAGNLNIHFTTQQYAQKPIDTWCASTCKMGVPEYIIRTLCSEQVETAVDGQKTMSYF